jgi:hypothetical protein
VFFRTAIPENLRELHKIIAPSPYRRIAVYKAFGCGYAALRSFVAILAAGGS